jgi:hypothetical protein
VVILFRGTSVVLTADFFTVMLLVLLMARELKKIQKLHALYGCDISTKLKKKILQGLQISLAMEDTNWWT